MKNRRLLFYVLLNILVSASVTGLILFFYGQNCRQQTVSPAGGAAESSALPSNGEEEPVEIVSIAGAGTLQTEVALIRYNGAQAIDLAGWRLRDEDGNVYIFPSVVVYSGGAVQVHSADGEDTIVDLYWSRREPVWHSGEKASLFDPQGHLRSEYQIP
jgi:hypothetical protein